MSKLLFKNILVLIKYLKYLIVQALKIIWFQRNIINGYIGYELPRVLIGYVA